MKSMLDVPVVVAGNELERTDNEMIFPRAQTDALPLDLWLGKTRLDSTIESPPATSGQSTVSPQAAGTVINSGEGFRYGYFTCSDPNGTAINLSDKISPADIPLHTMQDSIIQGHSTANDSFTITSDYHHPLYGSLLLTGGGNNTVSISSKRPPNSPLWGLITDAEMAWASTTEGHGCGMVNSSILAEKDSSTKIDIYAPVCAVYGSHSPGSTSIVTGGGDDTISLNSGSRVMYNASLHAGGGNDHVTMCVAGQSESFPATVFGSAIHLGDGDDTLSISGYGFYAGSILENSTILTGQGDDRISLYFDPANRHYVPGYLVSNSNFILGEGNDTISCTLGGFKGSGVFLEDYAGYSGDKKISISFSDELASYSPALDTSEINLGNGNDVVNIYAPCDAMTAVSESSILTGGGDDTINISVSFELGYALYSSIVDGGSGKNVITIEGDVWDSQVKAASGSDLLEIAGSLSFSTIELGSGNDILRLSSSGTLNATDFVLDGGSNSELDHARGQVGDILSLDKNYFEHLKNASGAVINGFEALRLDFDDWQNESGTLDSLLSEIHSSSLGTSNFSALIINENTSSRSAHDSISLLGNNTAYKGDSISLEGLENQTYSWYTAYEGTSQQMEIFVATGTIV